MDIYNDIYQTINQYIFNGGLAVGSAEHLATVIFSLTACFFCVAIPFLIVWKVIKTMLGGF